MQYFGNNQQRLADALGISKQAVSRWPDDGDIPERRALKLEHEILPSMGIEITDSEPKAAVS